ncbi:MAG TPA: TM0106 family RecB-like putative nuclease, partial [Candidatus Limnocylindrales bacterium]
MHLLDGKPVYSATDLVGFLACEHLTDLERAALAGLVERPHQDDAELDLIRRRGEKHEQRFLDELGVKAYRVDPDAYADAPDGSRDAYGARLRSQVEQTLAAMRRGEQVIYQAAFFDGTWRGHADFLRRVDGKDPRNTLGDYHYEVIDTKLAHKAKASALIQMCSYVDLLTPHQGRPPEHMYVALGGVERPTERFRVDDYMAYYRALKRRFEQTVAAQEAGGRAVGYPPPLSRPDPVEHCEVCRWIVECKRVWRQTDHLSLVAGISRNQRRSLVEEAHVDTRRGLAALPLPVPRLQRTNRESLTRVREQARLQVEGEDAGRVLHELLEPDAGEDGALLPGRGLAALPEPSPGDLFFDIEGDPFAFEEGLEYLWGVVEPGLRDADGRPTYHQVWALTKEAEKAAFERFIDFVVARRRADPCLHVYHYGSYERGRVARMSTRHATRELEVDELLRAGVFVDLFSCFRQGVRASVESYSIKRLEPLYGFVREVDLREAGDSIVEFERYLEDGGSDPSILPKIADYNRDDCLSAWRLRDWLEARRPEAEAQFAIRLPRPGSKEGAPSEEQAAARAEVAEVARALTDGLPPAAERTADEHARQLLADLLDWHWREEKTTWWRFYDLMRRPDDELLDEREPIAGLELIEVVQPGPRQRNARYRYRFPLQENEVEPGSDVHDPRLLEAEGGHKLGKVDEIDQVAGTLVIGRKPGLTYHPGALVPLSVYPTDAQRKSLLEIGRWVAEHGLHGAGAHRAARDLLLRASPRLGQAGAGALPGDDSGQPLVNEGETGADAALRHVLQLDATMLPIQGPPGSGKSTIGAQMILRLVDAGLKVGITANSHKVIGSLLRKVLDSSAERGRPVRAVQRADKEDGLVHDLATHAGSNEDVRSALDEGRALVAAGTAWLWSSEQMREAVDVLFVDEAGQLSLANALAVSVAARSLVLL